MYIYIDIYNGRKSHYLTVSRCEFVAEHVDAAPKGLLDPSFRKSQRRASRRKRRRFPALGIVTAVATRPTRPVMVARPLSPPPAGVAFYRDGVRVLEGSDCMADCLKRRRRRPIHLAGVRACMHRSGFLLLALTVQGSYYSRSR